MKSRFCATACALALLAATSAVDAQRQSSNRGNQDRQASTASMQFDDHARQTTNDWYNQHQNRLPAGLRSQDRLSADQESRLQPGRPLDSDLRQRAHPVPRALSRQLPPPPPSHRYVAIGGHVGMIDRRTQTLRDVIHLHKQ
jgi:Ni/Co efflux regulator RcnB